MGQAQLESSMNGGELVGPFLVEESESDSHPGKGNEGFHLIWGERVTVERLDHEPLEPEEAQRFVRALRSLRRLRSPHLNPLRGAGVDRQGTPYLAWTRLQGESLQDLLTMRRQLPVDETLEYLGPVMEATAYLHSQGVTHGGIDPSSVVVCRDARERAVAKLMDLGRSCLGLQSSRSEYVAPENRNSDRAPVLASDVWSIGALLYRCLTGELPGASVEKTRAHMLQAGIPAPLRDTVGIALAPDPKERFADVGAFVDALQWQSGRRFPTRSLRPRTPKPSPSSAQNRWVGAVSATLVVAGFGLFVVQPSGPGSQLEDGLKLFDNGSSAVRSTLPLSAPRLPPKKPRVRSLPAAPAVDSDEKPRANQSEPRKPNEDRRAKKLAAREAFDRAETLKKNGQPKEAQAAYDEALTLAPNFVAAIAGRADLRRSQGDFPGALKDAARALQLDPDRPELLNARARIHWSQRHLDLAVQDFEAAHQIRPDQPVYRDNLIAALFDRARARQSAANLAGARADLDRLLSIEPKYALALRRRGLLRLKTKDETGGREDLKRYLATRPDAPDRKRLEKILAARNRLKPSRDE